MYFKKHEKYFINNTSWGKNYEINKERKKKKKKNKKGVSVIWGHKELFC